VAKGWRIGSIEMEIKESVLGFETNPFAWFAYFAVHLISARQVSAVELNSPKHLSYDIQS
jgi:hypothetical protein